MFSIHRLIAAAFVLALTFFQCPCVALAQSAPLPRSKVDALNNYQQQLTEQESREKALRSKLQDMERELDQTRKELVSLAQEVKNNERDLQKLDRRIADMEEEHDNLLARLESDYGNVGNLILALQRIKRVPPEALLARPGAPLETAQSAMLLNSTLPSLLGRAENLKRDIDRLDVLQRELEADKESLLAKSRELDTRKTKMSTLLDRRKTLYSETQGEHKEQQEILRQIARKANDLQDLIKEIEQNKKRVETRRIAQKAVMSSPPPSPVRTAAIQSLPGKALFPVAGDIRINYREYDELGAISNGITIDGRNGGVVIAPMDGDVRFAGPFKRFGQLIIIEHSGGYHSLIAGLARIDTVAGRSVQKGEPVGLLDDTQATLYYELRRNGVPVDPSVKFGN
jgi:septal ring factor EnvC (AmiA/AmiB activator)